MTLYLHWYEDAKTIPLAQRLADGAARYQERFKVIPNVIQVSLDEPGDCGTAERIRELTKNNYRFGYQEEAKQ